ncbi:hypothetical protein BHM03_00040018 [Ensete ventricosum]|nr:hypothetical protein BHM03_00040018 [Ensete ventricosum]
MRGSDKPRVERKRVGGVDVQMDRLCESVDEGSKRKRGACDCGLDHPSIHRRCARKRSRRSIFAVAGGVKEAVEKLQGETTATKG